MESPKSNATIARNINGWNSKLIVKSPVFTVRYKHNNLVTFQRKKTWNRCVAYCSAIHLLTSRNAAAPDWKVALLPFSRQPMPFVGYFFVFTSESHRFAVT